LGVSKKYARASSKFAWGFTTFTLWYAALFSRSRCTNGFADASLDGHVQATVIAWSDRFTNDRIRTQAEWAAKTLKFGRIESGDLCVAVSVVSEREFPPPT